MNWRKPVINLFLKLTGSSIPANLKQVWKWHQEGFETIKNIHEEKLEKLLKHAYNNVPYYRRIFDEIGLITADGTVRLEKFDQIPVLTKDIIRAHYDELQSTAPLPGNRLIYTNPFKSGVYVNTSGGSTGEPVSFIQDYHYEEWNTANKLFFFQKLGKDIGNKEVNLWGSDKDVLEGTIGMYKKFFFFLYNRMFLNTFKLSQENFRLYAQKIADFQPVGILAYYDSMYELAKYIIHNNIAVKSPSVIVTTIGKLTQDMFNSIKRAFPKSQIIDQYGSREVGALAVQFSEGDALNTFPWTHKIEVVDDTNTPVYDTEGRILVTTLENYSMPLIRYEIGDLGIMNDPRTTREFSLKEVTGRIFAHFVREDGTYVQAQFFVTLMFKKDWVRKFKFVQRDYNDILVQIEPYKDVNESDLQNIKEKIHQIMGKQCNVEFEILDEINPTASGKYMYTVSEVVVQ